MTEIDNRDLKSEIEYIKKMVENGDKPSSTQFNKIAIFTFIFLTGFVSMISGSYLINKYKELQPHRNIALILELSGSIICFFGVLYALAWAITTIMRKWLPGAISRSFQGIWSGVFLFWIFNQICIVAFANGKSNGKILEHIQDWKIAPENYVGIFNTIIPIYNNVETLLILAFAWWISGAVARSKIIMGFGLFCFIITPFFSYYMMFLREYYINSLSILVLFLLLPALLLAHIKIMPNRV